MKIMVCYDRKAETDKLFKVAQKYALAFNGSIVLATTVAAGSRELAEVKSKTEKVFEAEKLKYQLANVDCETHLLYHGVSEEDELLEFAKQNKIDLIILGARKRSKLGKFLLGSVIQHLIMAGLCPVLAVPLDKE
jgi:nucleotide-binding universal stress UspA family protein